MKWQRKLGPPKPEESFHDLLARARMLEECEKQYAASANARPMETQKKPFNDRVKKPSNNVKSKENPGAKTQESGAKTQERSSESEPSRPKERRCFLCKEVGHLRRECPQNSEAPGRSRSQTSNTSVVEVAETAIRPEDLTESELEQLLARRRLEQEKTALPVADRKEEDEGVSSVILPVSSQTNVSIQGVQAVGNLVHLDLHIEGVPSKAMVDSGSQATIISRSTLHAVFHHL